MSATPYQHVAKRHMGDRLLVVKLDRTPRPFFRLVEGPRRFVRPGIHVIGYRCKRQAGIGRREFRIDLERPAMHDPALDDGVAGAATEQLARAQPAFVGLDVFGARPA